MLDPAPGMKTKLTAIVTALFNVLALTGVLDMDPGTAETINAGLVALIGLFLAMKIDRKAPPAEG